MNRQNESLYDSNYYNNCCGAPYVRGGAIWDFFCRVADNIVSRIAPHTVLDVGCAKGFLVEQLREKGVEAWGFDISESARGRIRLRSIEWPRLYPLRWRQIRPVLRRR